MRIVHFEKAGVPGIAADDVSAPVEMISVAMSLEPAPSGTGEMSGGPLSQFQCDCVSGAAFV